MERSKKIIQTSIIGIVVNVILVLFKATVGLATNSIAIILDAVNNLSDALSSVITIVGTKLAGKKPDKKHPYGYGRIEYLTSVIIAVLVLAAGITSAKESIEKIIHPEAASYTVVSLVIVAVAVLVKFFCGRYVKGVGEKLNSGSLVASGSDAFFDAILSFATLVAAIISMVLHVSLEGILGVVISAIIIKAGLGMLKESVGDIIGARVDPEMTKELKAKIAQYPGVRGAYDLVLHNYGPTNFIGSVHIEVPDSMTANEIHHLEHRIMVDFEDEYGIILTVGIYATNDTEPELVAMQDTIRKQVAKHPEILQMHGFYGHVEEKDIMFDMVVSFKYDKDKISAELHKELEEIYPGYRITINLDSDFSD